MADFITKLVLPLLSLTLIVKGLHGTPVNDTRDNDDCAPRGLSVAEKNALDEEAVDISPKDGLYSHDERVFDFSSYYDKNGDGILTETECVQSQECRFGVDTLWATYICNFILETKENGSSVEAITSNPDMKEGMSVEDWNEGIEETYMEFDLAGCEKRCLTNVQKSKREALQMDDDNDGIITQEEILAYLNTFYVVESDGTVSRGEFVIGNTCLYGGSAAQAHSRYAALNDLYYTLDETYPEGVTVKSWIKLALKQYLKFAKDNPRAKKERPCRGENTDGDSSEESDSDED